MKQRIIKSVLILLVMVSLMMMTTTSTRAEVITNVKVPIDFYDWLPYNGHLIYITGYEHDLISVIIDQNSGFHNKIQSQLKASGVDMQTGKKYEVMGVSNYEWNTKELPYEYTYTNNYRMIGQGSAPDFILQTMSHGTVNANGEVTADCYRGKIISK